MNSRTHPKMNILFLDDDLKRHHLFQNWLRNAQSRKNRASWLNLLRRQSQRQNADLARAEAAFTVEEAIQSLRDCQRFDVAFLDHDLGGRTFVQEREGTGTQVAEFITTMKPTERPCRIIVHSHNPAGARRMNDILLQRGCAVKAWPFASAAFVRCLRELEL